MMSKPTRRHTYIVGALLAGLLAAAGCHRSGSKADFVSLKDPYFPEHYDVNFDRCVYRTDPGGDLRVVACREEPAAEPDTPAVTQYLFVQVYWSPHPGKTPADTTGSNALLRYVVARGDGVAVYAGTGFAYPKGGEGKPLQLDVEWARLRLETVSGEVPDLLGDARLTARLMAREDPGHAAAWVRAMDRCALR